MKLAIRFSKSEEAKALPILLRHSPGMVLPDRTYVLNAAAVSAFARVVLRAARGDEHMSPPFTPALVRLFVTKSRVPGSSRALAWDTMLPTSSCGTRMSPSAFGHAGYTGTSLWIDPDRDRYFALLTNRARGEGSLDDMKAVRRAFHDALADL